MGSYRYQFLTKDPMKGSKDLFLYGSLFIDLKNVKIAWMIQIISD